MTSIIFIHLGGERGVTKCPVEIMKSLKTQLSKSPGMQCAQAQLNTSQCYLHTHPPQEQLSLCQLRSVSSLKEGVTHSKLERKSIPKQMSKDYNKESAESGTVWGKR